MNQLLPVQRASELSLESAPLNHWLIEGLWSDQAVGIRGGEPKCCKSFLALDLAVSVASGAPCLRRFAVQRSGPVLLFPAEEAVVRQRLEGICSAAGVGFQSLPVETILVSLRSRCRQRTPRLPCGEPFTKANSIAKMSANPPPPGRYFS